MSKPQAPSQQDWMKPSAKGEFPKWKEAMIAKLHMIHPRLPERSIRVGTTIINCFANSKQGGLAWVGKAKLALFCGVDERTIKRARSDLENAGVLLTTPRWDPKAGKNLSNLYQMLITRAEMKAILSAKKAIPAKAKKQMSRGIPPLEALLGNATAVPPVLTPSGGLTRPPRGGSADPQYSDSDSQNLILRIPTSRAPTGVGVVSLDSRIAVEPIQAEPQERSLKAECFALAREKFPGEEGIVGKYLKYSRAAASEIYDAISDASGDDNLAQVLFGLDPELFSHLVETHHGSLYPTTRKTRTKAED